MSISSTPISPERKLMFVDEHKHVLALFRSLRFWGWCLSALLPALAAFVYRSWISGINAPAVIALVIALGMCVVIVQSLLRGRVITNTGIFVRDSEPARFWVAMAFSVAMYAVAIIGIVKV